ncbi:hypothetical protein K2X85_19825 [bacterium]|nr:hypothetical protein [bacterium]
MTEDELITKQAHALRSSTATLKVVHDRLTALYKDRADLIASGKQWAEMVKEFLSEAKVVFQDLDEALEEVAEGNPDTHDGLFDIRHRLANEVSHLQNLTLSMLSHQEIIILRFLADDEDALERMNQVIGAHGVTP